MSARASGLLSCGIVGLCLAALAHASILRGEIFSPADLLYNFYPWAYDGPRIVASNPTRSDEAFVHQPLMATHWDRLTRGDLPEWDPSNLGGTQAFLDGLNEGQIFSPFSLPFYLLAPEVAVTVAVPLRLAAAAFFMWLFLGALGLSPPARLAGAVAFAFNGVFLVWLSSPIPTIALFLPLTCLLADRLATRGRARDAALLALALGVQFTGAYLPTSIALVAVTLAYGLWVTAWSPAGRARALGLLAGATLTGLAIGAVALGPMMATLLGSPVSTRVSTSHVVPLANLATLALPDFWGNPVSQTWWYPGDGNYPELVSYVGVSTLMLAGAGAGAAGGRPRREVFFWLLGLGVIAYVYAIPPIGWLRDLPFLRSMNAQRWLVAMAFAVPCLAAYGVEWMVRSRVADTGGKGEGPHIGSRPVVVALAVGLALGLAATWALVAYLPDIRARSLQPLERAQLLRLALVAAGAGCAIVSVAWRRGGPSRRGGRWLSVAPWAAAVLVAADLVTFGAGFNPTVPRSRYYPETPGLRTLRDMAGGTRVAFVGDHRQFPQGHVWGMFGLSSLTGFDFAGHQAYQAFLRRATDRSPTSADFGFIEIPRLENLDLRLLGVFGVELIVTAPEDVATTEGGFQTVGELVDQTVTQTFRAGANGLRRVDVLSATFGRSNLGSVTVEIADEAEGRIVAGRTVNARDVPNNEWLTVDMPEQPSSAGRLYSIRIHADGAAPGAAATVWATAADGYPGGGLRIDGGETTQDLWFRTFATAPDRFGGAQLAYARDLNIYRNPHARPRAWFVDAVDVQPAARHLERITEAGFDPGTTAVVEQSHRLVPATGASVVRVLEPTPDERLIEVRAPAGGVLVVNDRHERGWQASVDGVSAPLVRANHLLMALEVPAGAHEVRVWFTSPLRRLSWLVSALAAALALLAVWRRSG